MNYLELSKLFGKYGYNVNRNEIEENVISELTFYSDWYVKVRVFFDEPIGSECNVFQKLFDEDVTENIIIERIKIYDRKKLEFYPVLPNNQVENIVIENPKTEEVELILKIINDPSEFIQFRESYFSKILELGNKIKPFLPLLTKNSFTELVEEYEDNGFLTTEYSLTFLPDYEQYHGSIRFDVDLIKSVFRIVMLFIKDCGRVETEYPMDISPEEFERIFLEQSKYE